MIEPVMDALTTSVRPLCRAIKAMINSAAFPKVALSNPPTPEPTRSDRCSVARPINPATGMIAMQEQKNSHRSLCNAGTNLSATATGTKISSQSKENLTFIDFQPFLG